MRHKSGAPAIQPEGLACLYSVLNDAHNSASAAQNNAVQRRQQLCLAFQVSIGTQVLLVHKCLNQHRHIICLICAYLQHAAVLVS